MDFLVLAKYLGIFLVLIGVHDLIVKYLHKKYRKEEEEKEEKK